MLFRRISNYFVKNTGNLMIDNANQLFFMLIIVTFFYSIIFGIIGFHLNYTNSAYVNLSLLPGSLLALLLLKKGIPLIGKILLIIHADIIIALSCVYFSPDTYSISFLFPISICALVILPGKEKMIGYVLASFSLLLLIVLLLGDYDVGRPNMPMNELKLQWIINAIGAVTLTFLVTQFILNVNNQIQYGLTKKTEKEVLKNQELNLNIDTKNRLFSIISHDLRNPLVTIRGAFDMLNSIDVPDEKKKFLIAELGKRVDNTMVLMDNLLMWSRTQLNGIVYQPEIIDPNYSIRSVVRQLEGQAEEKKIMIVQQCPETVMINADRNMFELIFRNLISNSIKFTQPEGYINILIKKELNKVKITVSDSGIGMSTELIEKLRNKIFISNLGTQKEKGTGLGLVLCHEFIERNKGELIIESQLLAGTIITVLFDYLEVE